MTKVKLLLMSFFIAHSVHSQSSLNCNRQIVDISCGILSGIPLLDSTIDIFSNTSTYRIVKQFTFNGQPCFRFDSTTIGTTVNFADDDRLSWTIPIGFTFPFFGNNYTNNWISTNGYQTFDNTWTINFATWLAGGGFPSEFEILIDVPNQIAVPYVGVGIVPHNLPSGLYQNTHYGKLIFQSNYHDMNPALTSSPNRRINFFNTGAGTNRKFVTTWWKQPLYQCFDSIRNSHQSELWANGVMTTKILQRQMCPGWNDGGRAMIGIQNATRTVAYTPPGRRASDPLWFGDSFNEAWYFLPASGVRLFQSATLLPNNLAGIVTFLNNGKIAIRYDLTGEPFGLKTYISRKQYSDGTVIDDTIVINKILNPDQGLCTALSLRDEERISVTPTQLNFTSISNGNHVIEIFSSLGQLLSKNVHNFRVGGNTVDFSPEFSSKGIFFMRITDLQTRKTLSKTFLK